MAGHYSQEESQQADQHIDYHKARPLRTEPNKAIQFGSNTEQDDIKRIQRFYADDSIIVEDLDIRAKEKPQDRAGNVSIDHLYQEDRVDAGTNTELVQII